MKKYIVCILAIVGLLLMLAPASPAAVTLTDIEGHWAETDINQLAAQGLLTGYQDGTFRPNAAMTKAEYIAVLVKALDFPVNDTSSLYFTDIKGHWANPSINAAVQKGLLVPSEYASGLKPDIPVKRSEVAALTVRALGRDPEAGTPNFKDKADVQRSTYRGFITAAYNLGLIKGDSQNMFRPFEGFTRAEACVILNRFLAISGSLPATTSPAQPPTGSASTKMTRVIYNGQVYNPEYVRLYVNNIYGEYYLSDADFIDSFAVKVGDSDFDLRTDIITIALGTDYFRINKVDWEEGQPVVSSLEESEEVVIRKPSKSSIRAIYVDDAQLNLDKIDNLFFVVNGEKLEVSEVTIDAAGNFVKGGQTYAPGDTVLIADQVNYAIERITVQDNKFTFYCTRSEILYWVQINDTLRDATNVQIIRGGERFDITSVTVIRKNIIRLRGKEYTVSSGDIKCLIDNRLYSVEEINYDSDLDCNVLKVTEAEGSLEANQPEMYSFYFNNALYHSGQTNVEILADGKWTALNRIFITDPTRFNYGTVTQPLIGASLRIQSYNFKIDNVLWEGKNNTIKFYLQ